MNLEFYEDVGTIELRPIVPPKLRALRLAWENFVREGMRDNPNAKYHGKEVMVVGGHRLKGIRGTIRDTTTAGEAIVEVHVFNQPREKIPLAKLRIL